MNSLLNYGSDDDYDDSSEDKTTDWRGTIPKDMKDNKTTTSSRQTDANYEEVQMDLSEESNDSKPEPRKSRSQKSRECESKDRDRRDDYRSRHEKDKDKRTSRDKDKDTKYRDRRDRDRERERRTRRSASRERRRSRSPRRDRSRSRSRDRSRKYTKRYEPDERKSRQDPQKSQDDDKRNNSNNDNGKFFMPGITGRFRDQIERRKQLWQKKEAEPAAETTNGQSKKVWETTTFAQDADGKMANKFKRLMGIRNATAQSGQGVDVLKKQEEMFSSMEQQYEVARTATHTMRGVGLGFGSFQR